ALVAEQLEEAQRGMALRGCDEQVDVLRPPRDTGEAVERIGAADEEADAVGVHDLQYVAVELAAAELLGGLLDHHRCAPPASVTGISRMRNGGRSGNTSRRSGAQTLKTGTFVLVRPSGRPLCACPWNTAATW